MPGIGSAIFAMGLVCVFQTIQNYLIDMNVRYAASSVLLLPCLDRCLDLVSHCLLIRCIVH